MTMSNSSFIPKKTNEPRLVRRQRLNFFSLFVNIAFVGTLIGVVMLFIFERHTENQISSAVLQLDSNIKTFSEADFLEVQQFNQQLRVAAAMYESNISITRALQLFTSAIPKNIRIQEILAERQNVTDVRITFSGTASELDSIILFNESVREKGLAQGEFFEEFSYTFDSELSQKSIPFSASMVLNLSEANTTSDVMFLE